MGWFGWILDVAVIAMLAVALPMVVRLERTLAAVRKDRAAMDGSTAGLAEATRSAEAATLRLRATAEAGGRQLSEKLSAAEPVRDDLRYLVERAESLADRLEGLVRAARPVAQDAAPPGLSVVGGGLSVPDTGAAASRAERELLRALARGAAGGG